MKLLVFFVIMLVFLEISSAKVKRRRNRQRTRTKTSRRSGNSKSKTTTPSLEDEVDLSFYDGEGLSLASEGHSFLSTSPTPSTEDAKKTSCCQNGGLCVLGSFCYCKKTYYGRYCEYRKRPCGSFAHGEVHMNLCSMCVCSDGSLRCKVVSPDCEEELTEESDKVFRFTKKSIKQNVKNYQVFMNLHNSTDVTRWNIYLLSISLFISVIMI